MVKDKAGLLKELADLKAQRDAMAERVRVLEGVFLAARRLQRADDTGGRSDPCLRSELVDKLKAALAAGSTDGEGA